MDIILKRVRVLDPASKRDFIGDVAITDGKIESVAESLAPSGTPQIIDGEGLWAMPGFVDMHTHLREPGYEHKETIHSGAEAGAAGGYTALCCMPNTDPVIDMASVVKGIMEASRGVPCRIYPIGAVSKGQRGEELAELGLMARAGAVAFSDDGFPVLSGELLRNAMRYAHSLGKPIIEHCEDLFISRGGVINEGAVSDLLGLYGIPASSEENAVARDILIARELGLPIHITHISTAGTVELIRRAQADGIDITCDATPHHIALTEQEFIKRGYDTALKMKPPLRTEDDRNALLDGIADGTIAALATDHAPHAAQEKDTDIISAPFGVVGLETAASVVMQVLVHTRRIAPLRMAELMSYAPARLLGLPYGILADGSTADIALIDPVERWRVEPERFRSRGKNTPFAGWEFTGRVVMTVLGGEVVYTT